MNARIARRLPAWLIRWLVRGRTAAYLIAEPVDRVGLWLNRKTRLPPLWLRRYVGPPETFETAAAEFLCLLKLRAGLRADSAVLDIGCGCGALAIQLLDYLGPHGRYFGFDVHQPSVRWCQVHIAKPGFSFRWVDVHNATYNPHGDIGPEQIRLSEQAPFDVVIAKSLFTHVTPDVMRAYMRLGSETLSLSGTFVFTAFLFRDARAPEVTQRFPFGNDHFRHAYAHRVESAVAYGEQSVMQILNETGLKLSQIYPGAWRNDIDPISFQDVILVQRQL